ncbi:RDD family protein [Tenacibaculum amylolyticum]|uniref:RDD family protein n=1 Tax=Tenacibaculum amylolyticum TaxID=104269 RepID=UPI0038953903
MKNVKITTNIGDRFVAGLVDYFIIYGVTFLLIFTLGEPNDQNGYSLNGLSAFIPVLFWGLMTVGFEQFFGATLGNLLVGLKPVPIKKSTDNSTLVETEEKITFSQSLKRHLFDPIDMLFFGLVGIITIKNSELNQRVGDIWAHTVVVRNSELKN